MQPDLTATLKEQLARLSPEQRALLAAKVKEKRLEANAQDHLLRREPRDTAPLSFPQQRFWFLYQLEPDLPVYNEWTTIHLSGALDTAALEQTIHTLVQRHESLRTTFTLRDGQPVQIIHPNLIVPLEQVSLLALPTPERWSKAMQLALAETQRAFDLIQGPLFRVKLFQLGEQDYLLLQVFHHIIIDAWSATVLYRELGTVYTALVEQQLPVLEALPLQYSDFALWQRQQLSKPHMAAQLTYWKQQLADLSPLQLPTDHARPSRQTYRGAQHDIQLPATLLPALQALGQRTSTSLFMLVLATFQTLLHRYTGQEDIVIGSPIANRSRPTLAGLIGCFANTLALRSDFSGNPTFRTLLKRVRATVLDGLAHQDLPFEKLVEELQPERDLSRTPLFQVMLVYNNTALSFDQFGALKTMPVDVASTMARFDLMLTVMELDTGLKTSITYNADLFDATTIARMAGHLETLLTSVVQNPDQPIATLPLLTQAEQQQLLVEWNNTTTVTTNNQCMHQLFEQQVQLTPHATALVYNNQRLSYAQLNQRANQVAHYLQALGVGPEVPVGICLERCIELVVGLLGVLKAGGAYVPLDPSYPAERVALMLDDGQPLVLLTQAALLPTLPASTATIVCLDRDWHAIAQQANTNPLSDVTPAHLAYILYTSGSTGRPKGVEIEHRSPVTLMEWSKQVFSATDIAGVLASTSICFDLSVFELFVPLSRGGKVILAKNALHLATIEAANEVTLINTVPSAITELLRHQAVPASVQVVNLAGEPLKNALVQQIYQQTQAQRVFNLYGPSEDTTYSTFTLIERGANTEPTIGRPLANTQTYILDNYLQLLPIGAIGELYIGGDGLARGYRNQPELTAQKFILNPFTGAASKRLYKTGDLARYLADGTIEFLGRRDNQVKLRGFRIELGEIETVLSQHPAVQDAVVIVREDTPNDKRLVAYITNTTPLTDTTDLRTHLQQRLPYYMIPAAFVLLEQLPLTPNGKVDRRALPVLTTTQPAKVNNFVAASTPTEQTLAHIWGEILKVENPSIHDDFFELGGHSLLATQVISRCSESFQTTIALLSLFEERSIARLAAHIDQLKLAQALQQVSANVSDAEDEITL